MFWHLYKYRLKVDITNCYNSLYTHSITWAICGKDLAKSYYRTSEPVEIKDMYFFIFAHKTGDQEMNEVNQNQLRVYKVLKMDNTHIVDPMTHIPTSCWGNSNGYTDCGLFAGSVSSDTNDCILGFKYEDKEEQWYFYLPTLSYCLEGRTEDMINFGENYKGYFKINLPKLIE